MSRTLDSHELAEQWRAGDQQAARELFDRYARRLIALARLRISQGLVARVDPEDVVQSVFNTFFRRLREGEFQIDKSDGLWHLLVRITVCKTLRQIEHHRAGKRDPLRETPSGDATEDQWRELLSRDPSPVEILAFQDELEHFLQRLRPEERQIVEMRLAGCENQEICQSLGTYDRKVRRVLERIVGRGEREVSGYTNSTPVSPLPTSPM